MASFGKYSQFQILGEILDTIPLSGNLDQVYESTLTPAKPNDLNV
jgi:hypothetical protein